MEHEALASLPLVTKRSIIRSLVLGLLATCALIGVQTLSAISELSASRLAESPRLGFTPGSGAAVTISQIGPDAMARTVAIDGPFRRTDHTGTLGWTLTTGIVFRETRPLDVQDRYADAHGPLTTREKQQAVWMQQRWSDLPLSATIGDDLPWWLSRFDLRGASDAEAVTIIGCGWPMTAWAHGLDESTFEPGWSRPPPKSMHMDWADRVSTTRPVFLGLAVDTVALGAAFLALSSGFAWINRSMVRARLRDSERTRRCIRCGYDLSGHMSEGASDTCPECGMQVPPNIAAAQQTHQSD